MLTHTNAMVSFNSAWARVIIIYVVNKKILNPEVKVIINNISLAVCHRKLCILLEPLLRQINSLF